MNFFCKVCRSNQTVQFKISHFYFNIKKALFFFCKNCLSISEHNNKINKKFYYSGKYRDLLYKNIKPPIVPWSEISFLRYKHIVKYIEKYILLKNAKNYLDFGGYNGFLAYALKKINPKINAYVADYDERGLNIAKALGCKVINLKKKKIPNIKFDLITVVHVLEHLENPGRQLKFLSKKIDKKGIIYAEVPNEKNFPLQDVSHKINFSELGLKMLFLKNNFKILKLGFHETPKETEKYGYFLNTKNENIHIVASFEKNFYSPLPVINFEGSNFNSKAIVKRYINTNYNKILFMIAFKYFFKGIKFLRSFFFILSYATLEKFFLKFFRISLADLLKK